MWLFRSFVLRFLRREPVRCGVTLIGIALGVGVIVAVRLANGASLRGFEAALETMSGRASLEVVGTGFGIDDTRVADLGWLRGYGDVSPVIEGDVLVRRVDDRGARGGEMMRVLGVDILKDRPIRDYTLIATGPDARPPSARDILDRLLDPTSFITSESFARRHGLNVGDHVVFAIGDREHVMVIRGLLKNDGPAAVIDGNFALLDIAAAQWALDRLGRIDRLDVRLREAAAIDRLEADIAARLPDGLSVQRPERRGRQVERMLAAFHLNLTALSYIALVVGLFLVYNTVATSVIARRDEVGTLRALGVTRRQVLWLFLGEAIALALPGTALGIAIGRVLAHGAVALTATTVNALYIASAATPPALSAGDVAVALLVGIPLSVVAAAVPALEASRVTPTSAMRGADRLATRTRLAWYHLAVSPVLFLVGWRLATVDAQGALPVAGYASAVALVFGAAAMVPAVLFVVVRAARRWGPSVAGIGGELAASNLSGAIPRVSISVAALAVSLAMMVAIAVMVGSFRETVGYWVAQTLKADLFIGPATRGNGARQSTLSADVEAIVAAHPAVQATDRFRTATIVVDDAQVALTAGDFGVMLTHGGLLFKAPADGQAAMRRAIGADAVIVSEPFAIRHQKGVGDDVAIPTPSGVRRFRIEAVYFDYSSDRGIIAMDRETFARHFGEMAATGLTVYLRAGTSAEQVRTELLRDIGGARRVFVYTNAGLRTEVMRIFDATFAITWALEVIAIVIAILGVGATLLTLMLERRRDLAMLRLVGADRATVRRMVVVEAVLIGAASQAVGLVAGVALSLVLVFVINVQSFGWTIQFHLPWGFLAQMSAAILVATGLAGLYPARRATRLGSVVALHEE